WPPRERWGASGSGAGLGGLTMSDDGGLAEVEESLRASANSRRSCSTACWSCWRACSNCPMRACNASFCVCKRAHCGQELARFLAITGVYPQNLRRQGARERLPPWIYSLANSQPEQV